MSFFRLTHCFRLLVLGACLCIGHRLLATRQLVPLAPVTEKSVFSIITCTPGADLYSLFGHTAIRYQDYQDGRIIDWVYNYGTFQYPEQGFWPELNFYFQFSRGKLDYMLSRQSFGFFQEEYIATGRGIFEQHLNLSHEEKQRLLDLLEDNYQVWNRTYKYDFFYDNCSSRVRDIIVKAVNGQVDFTYVYPRSYTFRQGIQPYLDYQPWSDLGIDLALGLPCDYKIEKTEFMFLPDSLMNEFNYAIHGNLPMVQQSEEILPQDMERTLNTVLTPMMVFTAFLVIHVIAGFLFARRKKLFQLTDRIIFFLSGLTGLMVIFLWFFTDHTATKWNFNLLWANPLNIWFAFVPFTFWTGWKKKALVIYFFLLVAVLLFWFVLPQRLNLALIPVIFALLFTSLKIVRPAIFLGNNSRTR